MKRPAIFVDRDGVLIENRDEYIRLPEHIKPLAGALEACFEVNRSAYALVVVSNQSAVGRGILTLDQALDLNRIALDHFRSHGVRFDGAYICPHAPEDHCECRKPKPGMLLQAAREHDLNLQASFLVGDNITDMQAAEAAGATGVFVRTGLGARLLESTPYEGPVVKDLGAAVRFILDPNQAKARRAVEPAEG